MVQGECHGMGGEMGEEEEEGKRMMNPFAPRNQGPHEQQRVIMTSLHNARLGFLLISFACYEFC